MNVYRGSFGAHMALLLRRFRRVSAAKLVKGQESSYDKLWDLCETEAEALQFIAFVYCLLGNYVQRPAPRRSALSGNTWPAILIQSMASMCS